MKNILLNLTMAILLSGAVYARDIRNDSVLKSKMTLAVLKGLKEEQNLKCKIAIEEDGSESITYFIEDGRSKYSAAFLCSDGRSAVVKGVIGDGGQTQTESFSLVSGS